MTHPSIDKSIIEGVVGSLAPGQSSFIAEDPILINIIKTKGGADGVEFILPDIEGFSAQSSGGFIVESFLDGGRGVARIICTEDELEEIFVSFAVDLIDMCLSFAEVPSELQAGTLSTRIESWQDFLKTRSQKLSEAVEKGLFGELCVLNEWMKAGHVPVALSALWTGPKKTKRDFTFADSHALEVKTSTNDKPFRAKIDSLAQLDASDFKHLTLAAVKLSEDSEGMNLRELSDEIASRLPSRQQKIDFESLLVASGYRRDAEGRRLKQFKLDWIRTFDAETLPRLTTETAPGIVKAVYEINVLDVNGLPLDSAVEVDVQELLAKLTENKD